VRGDRRRAWAVVGGLAGLAIAAVVVATHDLEPSGKSRARASAKLHSARRVVGKPSHPLRTGSTGVAAAHALGRAPKRVTRPAARPTPPAQPTPARPRTQVSYVLQTTYPRTAPAASTTGNAAVPQSSGPVPLAAPPAASAPSPLRAP
jgi:hypothetical protein